MSVPIISGKVTTKPNQYIAARDAEKIGMTLRSQLRHAILIAFSRFKLSWLPNIFRIQIFRYYRHFGEGLNSPKMGLFSQSQTGCFGLKPDDCSA